MKRRDFITNTASAATLPFIAPASFKTNDSMEQLLKKHLPVNFNRDGLDLSPELYGRILQILIKAKDFAPDSYGLGGMIHQFEEKIALALGKEKAIFMPTGTLANHIVLRKHCTTNKRAIVQYNSHINRDTGDCATTLSGINMITLGGHNVIFEVNRLKEFLEDNKHGKVKTPIGVLSLETPVRRNKLKRIPFADIQEITKTARDNNIALHLDGARLYIDAAFSGKSVKEYTELFDTVYLSLYKSFNAVSGAILAGTKEIIDDLHHERRMFGGGLPSSWQQIAIANYFFDGYEERYKKAMTQFKIFSALLEKSGKFQIDSLTNGSNVFKLIPTQKIDHTQFKKALAGQQVFLPNWNNTDQCFYIKMNDSLVYTDVEKVVRLFLGT